MTMLWIADLVLTFAGAVLLALAGMLSLEVFASNRRPDIAEPPPAGGYPPTTILIPAHNEAGQIADTLHALMPQLGRSDSVLVIADNCTDDTAVIARSASMRPPE